MSRVPVLGAVTPPGSALLPLPRGMSLQSDTRCRPGWQPGFRGEQPLFALRCREMKGSRTRPWTCLRRRWLRGTFCFLRSSPGSPQSPRCSQLPNGLGDREGSPLSGSPSKVGSRVTAGAWGRVASHRKFGMRGRYPKPQTRILSVKRRELLSCASAKRSGWYLVPPSHP